MAMKCLFLCTCRLSSLFCMPAGDTAEREGDPDRAPEGFRAQLCSLSISFLFKTWGCPCYPPAPLSCCARTTLACCALAGHHGWEHGVPCTVGFLNNEENFQRKNGKGENQPRGSHREEERERQTWLCSLICWCPWRWEERRRGSLSLLSLSVFLQPTE